MTADDELTASDLHEKLKEKYHGEVSHSKRTASCARQDLGWTFETARYCQAIREANMVKYLQWCKERLLEKEDFPEVIFTDESSIQLERHRRKYFRRRGTPRKLKNKHKHPLKVHLWAGVSKRGATGIVIFTGIMTATRYGDILSSVVAITGVSQSTTIAIILVLKQYDCHYHCRSPLKQSITLATTFLQ